MLKQKLGQSLVQKLSPQQIQLMKLLQIPTTSLEQRIKEELEINPALDENEISGEEDSDSENEAIDIEAYTSLNHVDMSDHLSNESLMDSPYKSRAEHDNANNNDEEGYRYLPLPMLDTFHEYMLQQLNLLNINGEDKQIAKQIIGNIDDDGYLRRPLEAIIDDLAFRHNVDTNIGHIERILKVIQNSFEPIGVGARSLQESLIIQLHRREEGHRIHIEMAQEILTNHFEEFTKKHYHKLARHLNISEDELKDVIEEILKLNPKPASGYAGGAKVENYIIPDFIILNDDGELKLTLNSKNAPELRISSHYIEMLRAYDRSRNKDRQQREAVMFIKQKIDSAKWFIDAIRQRQQTMYKTMKAILDYQFAYFYTGDETRLKPMILKDISDKTGLDISTISRVANSKWVQTEFGTFRLKSFFSESLSTEQGDEVSTLEVKKILKDLVSTESKRKPLSDQKLTETLIKKGYNIARRTVAKYREQLNIPVARLRKEL